METHPYFGDYAEEYEQLITASISVSGERPEYFTEHKVKDAADYLL
jgi:hypothetical protein